MLRVVDMGGAALAIVVVGVIVVVAIVFVIVGAGGGSDGIHVRALKAQCRRDRVQVVQFRRVQKIRHQPNVG